MRGSICALLFCSLESVTILSQPPTPVRVLEGQPLKLDWTFSVQGAFRRVEFVFVDNGSIIVETSHTTTPFIAPAFEGRLAASTTARNATITFFSVIRTDSNNYLFDVLDSSGSTPVPLEVIVECEYTVNFSVVFQYRRMDASHLMPMTYLESSALLGHLGTTKNYSGNLVHSKFQFRF